jgi:eukaryotic-like serine/threonine-protein kinase
MIGQRLGPYEIVALIGKGGMAEVYRAYHASMDRFVAIKVIKRDIGFTPEGMERFQREAKLIARLEHPHLLPVHDFNVENEPPYIVMRYLEGGTLKDRFSQGRLTVGEIAHFMRQIGSALDYAHSKGVIHRDIKPNNIMLDEHNNAFLTDFGVARIASTTGMTQTGFIVGTPEYMAPEQAESSKSVDYRTDIYALGVTIFEMATGEVPYSGETPFKVLYSHIYDAIPSARARVPTLPAEFDSIINKAMAKLPENRYQHALELAEALLRAAGLTPMARPSQPIDPASPPQIASDGVDKATVTPLQSPAPRAAAEAPTAPVPPLPDTPTTPFSQPAPDLTAPQHASIPGATPPPSPATSAARRSLIGAILAGIAIFILIFAMVSLALDGMDDDEALAATGTSAALTAEQRIVERILTTLTATYTATANASQTSGEIAAQLATDEVQATEEMTPVPPTDEGAALLGTEEIMPTPTNQVRLALIPTATATHTPTEALSVAVVITEEEPTVTRTRAPTHTPTDTPTSTPTPTGTNTPTNAPTDTDTATDAPTPTNTPTRQPSTEVASLSPAEIAGTVEARLGGSTDETVELIALARTESDGHSAIYTMKPDGSELTRLTDPDQDADYPLWSTDGTRIAYRVKLDDDVYTLYVMNPDGSDGQRLTDMEANILVYGWSADDSLLMALIGVEERYQLFLMKAADGVPHQILESGVYPYPVWSPVANVLLYASEGAANSADTSDADIYRFDAVGTAGSARAIIAGEGYATYPVWLPDGESIIYVTSAESTNFNLHQADDDGSNSQRILTMDGDEIFPLPSTDGSRIVFLFLDFDEGDDLYIVNIDGTAPRLLHEDYNAVLSLDWSPDGRYLLYTAQEAERGAFTMYRWDTQTQTNEILLDSNARDADWAVASLVNVAARPVDVAACTLTAVNIARVRIAPSTGNAVLRRMQGGEAAIARTKGADGRVWYHLANEGWVRDDVVSAASDCATLPEVPLPPETVTTASDAGQTSPDTTPVLNRPTPTPPR